MQLGSKTVMLGSLAASLVIGASAAAQGAQPPAGVGKTQVANGAIQTKPGKGGVNYAAARKTLQCQHIITECKNLGFIQGQYKQDNGLWKDCFDPVVMGNGTPTRDGKPISVPVSSSDVQACRSAVAAKGQ